MSEAIATDTDGRGAEIAAIEESDPAWVALLAGIESDLDDPAPTVSTWTKPGTSLPTALADRAHGLHRRQQERMQQMRDELDDIRHQLEALRRVPAGREDAPAYLDVDG
ncbi:hypothetical protein [Microbacterium abyssi]|uniref:hypothetical protein n=1 Tax=Microbacterium abyssi TaxID=2782166 RepID=UPI0018880584|nr:hypothetical protein [Microbacterium sp. A18JL241]